MADAALCGQTFQVTVTENVCHQRKFLSTTEVNVLGARFLFLRLCCVLRTRTGRRKSWQIANDAEECPVQPGTYAVAPTKVWQKIISRKKTYEDCI